MWPNCSKYIQENTNKHEWLFLTSWPFLSFLKTYFNRFFGISRHGPSSHSFPSPFMSAFHLFQCPPTKEKFWKSSFKAHKQSNNKTYSSPPSFPPVHLFVLVSLVATVCHAVYSFFQTTCIANCIVMSCFSGPRPLASGIPSNTWPSSNLLSYVLLLYWVMVTLWLCFCRNGPFTCSSRS